MLKFIIKRILLLIPIMIGVITVIFILRALTPGDPIDHLAPSHSATEEQREAIRAELGLDKPLIVQYFSYLKGVFTGDFGISYQTKQPITQELMARLPTSLIICFGSVVLGLLLGVPLGVISAVKQYSWTDSVILFLSILTASTPGFVLALGFIAAFAVALHWLPAVGVATPLGYIMPVATIMLASLAQYTRITRSSMLEIIRQDYINTARAKGQTEGTITVKHALRNALIPVVQAAGNQLGIQLGGAFIVEAVFGVPGIGKYIADSITVRDFPVIQGGVIVLALVCTIFNLLVDVVFVIVDPRLKTSILGTSIKIKKKRAKVGEQKALS